MRDDISTSIETRKTMNKLGINDDEYSENSGLLRDTSGFFGILSCTNFGDFSARYCCHVAFLLFFVHDVISNERKVPFSFNGNKHYIRLLWQ